ncbi:MAG TPA: hypothetical protein VGM05_17905 [Planctomycetaceae bacterium]|jgi:hypothetical protein
MAVIALSGIAPREMGERSSSPELPLRMIHSIQSEYPAKSIGTSLSIWQRTPRMNGINRVEGSENATAANLPRSRGMDMIEC